jgi:hypothetical protein
MNLGAVREWATFWTAADSAAVFSRKQTGAIGRLHQQVRRGFHNTPQPAGFTT